MDLDIERVKTAGHKSKAIIATLGLGVSAFAGALIFDDSPADTNNVPESIDQPQDSPQEISSQIDQNRNKLESLSTSNEGNKTDYTLMGC
jgi:hypothetical protein